VTITAIHTTIVDRTDHRRQHTLGTSSQPFQTLEQLGQLPPVEILQVLEIDQLVDLDRHDTHLQPPIRGTHRSGEVGTHHPKQRV
jgi:hypothetical protein